MENCVSFWSHLQSRGGSCSELSCLRSKDVLSVAQLYHQLTDISWQFYHLPVFSKPNCLQTCGNSVVTLRTFVFIVVLDTLLPLFLF